MVMEESMEENFYSSFPYSNSWYYRNGYLTIDLDLFGENLSILFSNCLNEEFKYQKIKASIETDKNKWPIWNMGKEERYLAIISPIKYSKEEFIKITDKPYIKYDGSPTLFKEEPINLSHSDYLLCFDNKSLDKALFTLGTIEGNTFIPSIIPIQNNFTKNEIIYNNVSYDFVRQFIILIFEYKMKYKKVILTQNDMNIILEEMGLNRNNKIQELIMLLKDINKKTEKIISESSVEKILKLQK